MKNKLLFISLFLFVLLSSCSQHELNEVDDKESQFPSSNRNAEYNVGIENVKKFINIFNDENKNIETIAPFVINNDTLLFIVNYEDSEGWILISGDKRTPAVLASSDQGMFDIKEINPNVLMWLNGTMFELSDLIDNPEKKSINSEQQNYLDIWNKIEELTDNEGNQNIQTKLIPSPGIDPEGPTVDPTWQLTKIEKLKTTEVYGPHIQTKWGQGYPWNEYVPLARGYNQRCLTGCVAVAGSQMLYYLHNKLGVPQQMYTNCVVTGWSDGGSKDYSMTFSAPSSSVWSQMARSASEGKSRTDNVAILMAYVGHKVNMDWGIMGSEAKTDKLMSVFSEMGINCQKSKYNSSIVSKSLKNGFPVMMRGYSEKTNHFLGMIESFSGGHAWIVDGLEVETVIYMYHYMRELFGRTQFRSEEGNRVVTEYIRMNWGWNGSQDNGLYYIGSSGFDDYRYEKEIYHNFEKK